LKEPTKHSQPIEVLHHESVQLCSTEQQTHTLTRAHACTPKHMQVPLSKKKIDHSCCSTQCCSTHLNTCKYPATYRHRQDAHTHHTHIHTHTYTHAHTERYADRKICVYILHHASVRLCNQNSLSLSLSLCVSTCLPAYLPSIGMMHTCTRNSPHMRAQGKQDFCVTHCIVTKYLMTVTRYKTRCVMTAIQTHRSTKQGVMLIQSRVMAKG